MGGDEFAVAMARAGKADAQAKADALIAELASRPFAFEGLTAPLGASIGVHQATALDTADTALRAADAAMYKVKGERASYYAAAPAIVSRT